MLRMTVHTSPLEQNRFCPDSGDAAVTVPRTDGLTPWQRWPPLFLTLFPGSTGGPSMPLGPSRVAHCFAVSMQCPTGHRRQRAEPRSLTAAALPRIRWKNRRDSGSSTGAPANGMVHVGSRAIGPRWPTTSQDPGGLLWDPLWLWSKLAAGKLDLVVAE